MSGYRKNGFRTSHLSFKNMVDRRAGQSRRSYNTEETVAHLVADNDSDIEQL